MAGPYLRCLEDNEGKEVLKDIHEGDCGNHTGGRSLCSKILRTGYFWPTMKRDALTYAQKCVVAKDIATSYTNQLNPYTQSFLHGHS